MQKDNQKIDFIGIGAPKSGSTWMSKCLAEHPQILFTSQKSRKEIHFFNVDDVWGDNSTGRMSYYDRGLDWYLDQFPESKDGCIRGEFSVTYLADPVAYKRIHDTFPNVKIIASLRNPIDMVYSLYWYFKNGAVIDLPDTFEEALDKGIFIDKGMYYKYLKLYYGVFPKENIKVVLFDDIKSDPKGVLKDIFKFLGVDTDYVPESIDSHVNEAFKLRSKLIRDIAHSVVVFIDKLGLSKLKFKLFESRLLFEIYSFLNKKPGKYQSMNDSTRKRCYEIFKEDIANLEKLINRDLSSWKY